MIWPFASASQFAPGFLYFLSAWYASAPPPRLIRLQWSLWPAPQCCSAGPRAKQFGKCREWRGTGGAIREEHRCVFILVLCLQGPQPCNWLGQRRRRTRDAAQRLGRREMKPIGLTRPLVAPAEQRMQLMACALDAANDNAVPLRRLGSAQITWFNAADETKAMAACAIDNDVEPVGSGLLSQSLLSRGSRRHRGLRGLSVLELGAGTGLTALAAAKFGARVVATDASELCLRLLRAARDANPDLSVAIEKLDF